MYISRDDLAAAVSLAELTQLTNDEMADYRTAEPDWAMVDRAIAYACELADGYLMGRYALPLSPVPTMLRLWCTDLARYWLHKRRFNGGELPKELQLAYDDAVKLLKEVQAGKLHLGVRDLTDATEQVQPEPGAYHVRAPNKQDWSGY